MGLCLLVQIEVRRGWLGEIGPSTHLANMSRGTLAWLLISSQVNQCVAVGKANLSGRVQETARQLDELRSNRSDWFHGCLAPF